ncbi:SigE family RNA polymerase sigma factor [Catenulispora yoronensis]|uniref:SigE family RNA polymerase sigma factor n=1 Tax=Catenulispora yoronensis TaxID=450799 RepID=A0ABN2VCX9_9ACTN
MGWIGRSGRERQDAEFTEYARARAGRLRETAYLLCGDWHRAQDLTQATLARVYVAWPKIERAEAVDAYARRVLTNEFLGYRRRRSSSERVTDELPETAGRAGQPELRLTLLEALGRLSPARRAVVVLRYWEDHSIETVAEMLGMSTSAVKSASLRALAELRSVLGADFLGDLAAV